MPATPENGTTVEAEAASETLLEALQTGYFGDVRCKTFILLGLTLFAGFNPVRFKKGVFEIGRLTPVFTTSLSTGFRLSKKENLF